jgi:hypothetical protein
MAQILLTIGSIIFLLIATLHGVLTLRDVSKPRAFTPPTMPCALACKAHL